MNIKDYFRKNKTNFFSDFEATTNFFISHVIVNKNGFMLQTQLDWKQRCFYIFMTVDYSILGQNTN